MDVEVVIFESELLIYVCFVILDPKSREGLGALPAFTVIEGEFYTL